ncbi:hypothetical protein NHX12_014639, partial [Muraenolepis orangiensis]
ERLAKVHGSQFGFCTPGMVMSMYTLLRNNPQPSMEEIREALGGNLCRCTGYRPIIDAFKTFSQLMAKRDGAKALHFQGQRVELVAPVHLHPLLQLKAQYPNAPKVVGNTTIGPQMLLKGVQHPLVICAGRMPHLRTLSWGSDGGTRDVPLNDEFFTNLGKTALTSDEILLWVHIPYCQPWQFVRAYRQAQRREFAFSIVNAGMKVSFRAGSHEVQSLNVFYGGVSRSLVRAKHTSRQDVSVNLVALEDLSALKTFRNEMPQGQQSFQVQHLQRSRSDPDQIQIRSRSDPDQIQIRSRSDPDQIQIRSRSDPDQIQIRSRSDPDQIQIRSI